MIVSVAFCPHPPVLVPAVAQGAAAELDDLRAACREAITRIAAPGRQLVLLGAGPSSRAYQANARGTFAGYGVPLEVPLGDPTPGGTVELPLALTVGAWLVRDALGPHSGSIGFATASDSPDGPALDSLDAITATDADIALIVLGDGSARRSTAAPGYFDERAEQFDAQLAGGLRSGDGAALSALDAGLGAELLAAGVPAWHAAARLLGTDNYEAELLYDQAPYGVGYVVAAWT